MNKTIYIWWPGLLNQIQLLFFNIFISFLVLFTKIPETLLYFSNNAPLIMNNAKRKLYENLRDYYNRTRVFIDIILPSFTVKDRYIKSD